ncbi:uncharacterized protein LOC119372911 [Rhipicephalus sanguineus]|uniref:uncharacterized protein LOC119372911 n=1 Tax=Rhipicephalus sanguineus TaxID=34632 RepID=UPI0018947686|nr:uncharacterized protein LOC119372911 [Rhipicephalus sanguineus]
MSPAHSCTNLSLIVNHLLLVFVNSLSLSPEASTMYLPDREASGGRATDKNNELYYGGSGGSSRGSSRRSQEMIAKSSSNPHVAVSERPKVETLSQTPLSSPALNVTVPRRAEGELRVAAHHSKKSQSLIAGFGLPYYPVAVGFRRLYIVPYPWAYYAVYPTSWRPPVTPVINVPVVVHVHPQIVPVHVPTLVSNAGGGGLGFVPGGDSGVAGSGNPTAEDGIGVDFVPTYRCGTVKAANCQG